MRFDPRAILQRFISRGIFAARDRRVIPVPGASEPLARLPSTHQDAALRLSEPAAFKSARWIGLQDRVQFDELEPDLVKFLVRFRKELERRAFPMYVIEGLRSPERQAALVAKGVSKAPAGRSAHQYGMAVDIVHYRRLWGLTEKEWAVIGLVGKEVARKCNVKVRWGGDWRFYDPAHWELADWSDRVRGGLVR